jgi:hypothetical protein
MKRLQNMHIVRIQNVQSMKYMLNMLKFVKCAEYAEYDRKDLFSEQNQVPGFASSLPGKYGQQSCLILILRFQHCPLFLASICCGAAFLETQTVLHW